MKTTRNRINAEDKYLIGSLIGGLSVVVMLYTTVIALLMNYIGSAI